MIRPVSWRQAISLCAVWTCCVCPGISIGPLAAIQKAEARQQKPQDRRADQEISQVPNSQALTGAAQDTNTASTGDQQRNQEIAIQSSIGKFTFWLVIVGGVQAVWMLVGLFITLRAANAAHQGADAARKSIEFAERSLRLTERARVSVGRWRVTKPPSSDGFSCSFRVENFGRTAATVLSMHQHAVITEEDIIVSGRVPLSDEPALQGPMLIEASQKVAMDTSLAIGSDDAINIAKQVCFLVVAGRLVYSDVFGDVRTIGFGVIFDQPSGDLVYLPNPKYNYEQEGQPNNQP